jgi:hypothetical protein
MNTLSKNKIKTAGYFIKRLRDNGFIVIKVFAFYAKTDQRRWTILVNPGEASVYITCYQSVEGINDYSFELNDGGKYIAKNIFLKTDSIEVIIEYLLRHGVTNRGYYPGKDKFVKKLLNNYDGTTQNQTAKVE